MTTAFLHDRKRFGFTLVELLVVITIIGILVLLLLPAIQAAREAGRQAQCMNHLKQLGLALHQYESMANALPPGAFWFGSTSTAGNKGSILVHLLPFVEQHILYDNYDFNTSNVEGQYIRGTTTEIRSTIIPIYLCPSDSDSGKPFHVPASDGWWLGTGNTVGLSNYSASGGANTVTNNSSCSCASSTNWNTYALGTFSSKTQWSGPFNRNGISARFTDITDGLSNTIFMGEIRPLCSVHSQRGWEESCNGNGLTSTVIPMNFDTCSRSSSVPDNCHRYCNWGTEWGFRSRHPGGVQFIFGDGGVRFLHETLDHQTYQYLGAKADGHVASF